MNKRYFLFLLASLFNSIISVGCKSEKASTTKELANTVVSPLSTSDSVVVEKDVPLVVDSIGKSYSTNKGTVDFAYSFPKSGPQPLVDSLRAYLSSEMRKVTDYVVYDGVRAQSYKNLADGKGMINYYAKVAYTNVKLYFEELEDSNSSWTPAFSSYVMKENETTRYVSYTSSVYIYSGGAHGMSGTYGVTFDKKTGAMLRNILKVKNVKELQPILRAGVESYFRSCEEDNGTRNVSSRVKEDMAELFLKKGIIPLPEDEVYLSPKGVVFGYGQYEVGPYAIGMPTFTVSYDKIKRFLSPEAKHLAGVE